MPWHVYVDAFQSTVFQSLDAREGSGIYKISVFCRTVQDSHIRDCDNPCIYLTIECVNDVDILRQFNAELHCRSAQCPFVLSNMFFYNALTRPVAMSIFQAIQAIEPNFEEIRVQINTILTITIPPVKFRRHPVLQPRVSLSQQHAATHDTVVPKTDRLQDSTARAIGKLPRDIYTPASCTGLLCPECLHSHKRVPIDLCQKHHTSWQGYDAYL